MADKKKPAKAKDDNFKGVFVPYDPKTLKIKEDGSFIICLVDQKKLPKDKSKK